MAVYYNDNDPFVVQWLCNLIGAGLIADGVVDNRSIMDVRPEDLEGFEQCHFFAGIGGWSLALRLAGWPDDRPVWTGSPPCQPFSAAGKQLGKDDERHLAPVWLDLIRKCKPPVVFGEQVASAIRHGWLDDLQDALEAESYAVGKVVLPACSVGAPHIRQRLWFVAQRMGDSCGKGLEGRQAVRECRNEFTAGEGGMAVWMDQADSFWRDVDWIKCNDGKWRPVESGTFPLADGVSNLVGRLRGYGNAIVPQVAAEVISSFMECRP